MSEQDPKDKDVGYKKPPISSRFKPGQSGNHRGRPKGSQNFSTIMEKELSTRVPVSQNGRQKRLTKKHIIAARLVNKAVEGDPKAVPIVLIESRLIEERNSQPMQQGFVPLPEDDKVMQSIIDRIRNTATNKSGDDHVDSSAE